MMCTYTPQAPNFFNLTIPPYPYLGWTFRINDQNGKWWLTPRGHVRRSIIVFAIFGLLPLFGAFASVAIFRATFYAIKVNTHGLDPRGFRWWKRMALELKMALFVTKISAGDYLSHGMRRDCDPIPELHRNTPESTDLCRKVLIATLEYEILGWEVKVRSVPAAFPEVVRLIRN